jgi:two-component system, NarL family, nitrate/nitrite response regulator NarL
VESPKRIRIVLYSQQPFVAEGLAAVLRGQTDLELAACRDNLSATVACLKTARPDLLVIYLVSGISLSDLREVRSSESGYQIVLWGQELGGEFAFQAMQLGVRSILPANTSKENLLASLRNVHRGVLCFEKDLLESVLEQKRVALTPRQGQIVSLVSQGLKNKEIAFSLGITEGTVKVYLYKLFKKLGVNDRLDMALYGRRSLFGGQPGLERTRVPVLPVKIAKKPVVPRSLLLIARKPPGIPVVH